MTALSNLKSFLEEEKANNKHGLSSILNKINAEEKFEENLLHFDRVITETRLFYENCNDENKRIQIINFLDMLENLYNLAQKENINAEIEQETAPA